MGARDLFLEGDNPYEAKLIKDMKTNNWINAWIELPKQSDEYNVVWLLHDYGDPVAATFAFDADSKTWTDSQTETDYTDNVLLWQPLPEVPLIKTPFEVIDALGGDLSGDYKHDLLRLMKSNRVCSQKVYDEAYQMDQQP
jgi:hypothetical protein